MEFGSKFGINVGIERQKSKSNCWGLKFAYKIVLYLLFEPKQIIIAIGSASYEIFSYPKWAPTVLSTVWALLIYALVMHKKEKSKHGMKFLIFLKKA